MTLIKNFNKDKNNNNPLWKIHKKALNIQITLYKINIKKRIKIINKMIKILNKRLSLKNNLIPI